ncbi:MAG: AMP-binding protein [Pseudomonadota bacterium]
MDLNTLPAYLNHRADTQGDEIWLRDLRGEGSDDYTWSEVRRQVNAVAAALEARFGNQKSMVLLSNNRAHWFMADLAIISSGNVTVSMFTTLPQATAKYIAEFSEAQAIFVGDSPNWSSVREVLPEGVTIIALPGVEIDGEHLTWEGLLEEGEGKEVSYQCAPDDMMSLVFTSGTTGLPKGVIQTHESNLVPIKRFLEEFNLGVIPRYLSYLPLSHIAERQIVEFSSLVNGGTVYFNESLEHLLRDLQRTRPQVFFGPPRIWEQFQQAVVAKFGGQEAIDAALAEDAEGIGKLVLETMGLGELVYCLTAAAPTPPPLISWWESMGLTLMEGFGQTEAMGLIISTDRYRRVGSVGKPVPGVELKLTEADELVVRAGGCTPGYYKQPEKTAELIQDGWLHTGDKARIDEDGFVFITGRVKDYFKTIQGKFVAPPPIEGQFAKNPHVEQQCLMGRGFSKTVMVAVLADEAQQKERSEVEASILETISEINESVEKHARIGAVMVSKEPWSIENEVLTPTLKIRREKVDERFAERGESLARESAEQGKVLVEWA